MKTSDPSLSQAQAYSALFAATVAGDVEAVRRFLPLVDPEVFQDSNIVWQAAVKGHVECLQSLIPVCNPKQGNSSALRGAVGAGNVACVNLLLPVCDADGEGYSALMEAVIHDHRDCVEILLPWSDVWHAVQLMRKDFRSWPSGAQPLLPHLPPSLWEEALALLDRDKDGPSREQLRSYIEARALRAELSSVPAPSQGSPRPRV